MSIIMDKFLTDFKGDAICNHETYKGILLRDGDYDVQWDAIVGKA